MRALIQRAASGSVTVDGKCVGSIGSGLVILLGVGPEDTSETAAFMADKCAKLRIFSDDAGKMNLSLLDVGGAALVVSQFTLYGDATGGRRPFFGGAAAPELAEKLYEAFMKSLRGFGVTVASGLFGAEMRVELVNDGPVTLMLDSDDWEKCRKA